jgi:hypothetical protein
VARFPAALESAGSFTCPTNKTAYKTKREAQAALGMSNPGERSAMHTYRCAYCEHYHLGHRRGRIY